MKNFIQAFPQHIENAIKISKSIDFNLDISNIDNIVISGQGGSAIGGIIVKNLFNEKLSVPILINQDYKIPSFVNNRTLFIASSYSGDTEEALCALREAVNRKSAVFCVCSGGKMLNFAKEQSINHIIIPSGSAPRAMLAYSIIQILFLISRTWNILNDIERELLSIKQYLLKNQNSIIKTASQVVLDISNKMPFIYTFPEFEGVAIRFKQQLNENSKRHACYNLIPEMNHNEIVPWVKKNICVVPIFLNGETSSRNKKRMELNISSIKKNVENIINLDIEGIGYFQQYFYFIHLVDWISVILAEKENINPDDIELINSLKNQLKEI